MLKAKPDRKAEESCRKLVEFDEFEYTTDSFTSVSKARQRPKDTVKVRPDGVGLLCRTAGCREVAEREVAERELAP